MIRSGWRVLTNNNTIITRSIINSSSYITKSSSKPSFSFQHNNHVQQHFRSLTNLNNRSYCSINNTNNNNIKKEETEKKVESSSLVDQINKVDEQIKKVDESEKKIDDQSNQEEKKEENKQGEEKKEEEKKEGEEKVEEPKVLTPEEKRKKLISKIRWTTILSLIAGTLGFLFYESHMRHTIPFKVVMRRINTDVETLRRFGGAVAQIPWYKCFLTPIYGHVSTTEGGMRCESELNIPIMRYTAPPLKEGEAPKPVLPEDQLYIGQDGGAQVGYIRATLRKKSPWYYDWKITKLVVECDQGKDITIIDYKLQIPTSRF